jgi:ABC-2 type transport system permease protein
MRPGGPMTMLYLKAWRESRFRFFLGAAALSFLCLGIVLYAAWRWPSPKFPNSRYTGYVWAGVHSNLGPMLFLWASALLGLGGLQRERISGTAVFTLSLPASRASLVLTRAAVGLIEVAALSLLPAVLVSPLSASLVGQSYPFTQSLGFAVLYFGWGALFFGVSFFLSVWIRGEVNALAICLLVVPIYRVLSQIAFSKERLLNPILVMNGEAMDYLDPVSRVFIGPLPYHAMAILVLSSALLIGCACAAVMRQEA